MTRPGGAALNAGQVCGTRVAEHVAGLGTLAVPEVAEDAERAAQQVMALLQPGSPLTAQELRREVQGRMSDRARIFCSADVVSGALAEARALNAMIRAHGISADREGEAARVFQRKQMALASEAGLAAQDHYIRQGGGSRGARAIRDPQGGTSAGVGQRRAGALSLSQGGGRAPGGTDRPADGGGSDGDQHPTQPAV